MTLEIENQIKACSEDKLMREKVRRSVRWLDEKGCLIMSVDKLAVRYLDRNMNKCSYPFSLIE